MQVILGLLFKHVLGESEIRPFKWGVSTAAFQIEGGWNEDGRGPSIWDTFAHRANSSVHNNDTGDVADDHYHRWEQDIELMSELGVKNYRFSISWSRVLPTGFVEDGINWKGIEFYSKIVDKLLEKRIEPYVCLYHWDLPQGLEDRFNGWLDPRSVDAFEAYASLMFRNLGDRVKHWFSFNEPLSFTLLGYFSGVHAPGRSTANRNGDSWKDPYTVSRHVLLSHARAAKIFREHYFHLSPDASFSIVVNCDTNLPMTNSQEDKDASERSMIFSFAWWVDPLFFGQFPQEMLQAAGPNITEFSPEESKLLKGSILGHRHRNLGVNHYTSSFVSAKDLGPDPREPNPRPEVQIGWAAHLGVYTYHWKEDKIIGARSDSSWLYVVPKGMRFLMNWVYNRYKSENIGIMITENGVDVPEESHLYEKQDILHDAFRTNYLMQYLEQLRLAIQEDKVPVSGYFVWSFLGKFAFFLHLDS